jgi:hypothetical protein
MLRRNRIDQGRHPVRRAASSVVATVVLLIGLAVPANADVDPAAVKRGIDAARTMLVETPQYKSGELKLPRLGDGSKGAALLKEIWNLEAVVRSRPQEKNGTPDIMTWGELAQAVTKLYVFDGGAQTDEAVGRNVIAYWNEIAHGNAFNWRSAATTLQGLEDLLASLPPAEAQSPVRQAGRKKMAAGLLKLAMGSVKMLGWAKDETTTASARMLAEALAGDMPILVSLLDSDARARLRDAALVASGSQTDTAVAAALVRFATACGAD